MDEQKSKGHPEGQHVETGVVNADALDGLRQASSAESDGADADPDADAGDLSADADEDFFMEVVAELPTPDADSPESLIGSTAATRDVVPSDVGSVVETTPPARTPAAAAEPGRGSGPTAYGTSSEPAERSGMTAGPDFLGPLRSNKVSGPAASASPITPASPADVLISPVWVSLDDLDELTIVARAQDGDPEAFEWLISAYQGGVYRLCFRMLNDRSEAEDIVQETFIAAWRSLPKLTVPQAFIPWLYRTATNKCLDDLRRRKRRPTDPTSDTDLETHEALSGAGRGSARFSLDRTMASAGQPVDPAQDAENQAQMRALADLLQTVPAGPRACWLLREVHDFSYAEIAAIVQLPESTIRGRIARARRFLAEGMEPWR